MEKNLALLKLLQNHFWCNMEEEKPVFSAAQGRKEGLGPASPRGSFLYSGPWHATATTTLSSRT